MSLDDRHQDIFQDDSGPESGHFRRREDHETHTTALVFLTLTVAVVVAVVFVAGNQEGASPFADWSHPDSSRQPNSPLNSGITSGSVVPVEHYDAQTLTDTSGFPPALPIPAGTSYIKNTAVDLDGGLTRRTIVYDSQSPRSTLQNTYVAWLKERGFSNPESETVNADVSALSATSTQGSLQATFSNANSRGVRVLVAYTRHN